MSRLVSEWVGSTSDAKVPARVRLRVFERERGICWISGRKIMPGDQWDVEHKTALINGGENRESNLFPALRDKHREKTKEDVAEKSKIYQKRSKHLGIKRSSKPMPGSRQSKFKRKMNGTVERRS